ncbi:helix-turn-helix domain-containing protein [Clostridium novyi]|uniref:helix-turn-helix domain-containing protein n=1 Tax=Clostridium novyi TaxID=1542 RepID=UPI0006526BF4|nr:helix-turn-helix transcriptional regulator [Clostridium novyi]
MNIGEKIKIYRKSNKLTQKDLAKKANISRSYLADIENNRYNASVETLKAIAIALNISFNELFEDKNYELINKENSEYKEHIFTTVPKEFTNPIEARTYVDKHQIFGANGFDSNKLDDNEILEFANELLKQMELISFKYKK